MGLLNVLKHSWNLFMNARDPTRQMNYASSYSYRPDRQRFSRGNERSIVTAIYNRIALDVAAINIKHVQLDKDGRYESELKTDLNQCLTIQANIDQTSRAFVQDIVQSMFDEGVVAIVPIDTTVDPNISNSYDIQTMRTAKILEWFPAHVRVRVYNDQTGNRQDIVVPKETVAIVENPLYSIINEPNSIMQRLIRKLNLLDIVDEDNTSNKWNLIIQLPYSIKSPLRREQANLRIKDIETQLANSEYGVTYIDSTEHVTQLNRQIENNLMEQIEYLMNLLYAQLGINQSILDGTADDKTMLNYYNRTIEPIISAITDEMTRKFLTKTGRTQGKAVRFYRDPFRLVPVNDMAEIADKFTRNEIMTSNEIRQVIGMKPSDDPEADELRNKNLSKPNEENEEGVSQSGSAEDFVNRMKEGAV